jgi:hypothetical protein
VNVTPTLLLRLDLLPCDSLLESRITAPLTPTETILITRVSRRESIELPLLPLEDDEEGVLALDGSAEGATELVGVGKVLAVVDVEVQVVKGLVRGS